MPSKNSKKDIGFLVDANLPYSCKSVLKEFGYKAFHVRDMSLRDATDDEIFKAAQRSDLVILTRDLDFANAVKFKPGSHGGIVVMRAPYFATAKQINQMLKSFISDISPQKIKHSLVILEIGKYRIREH